MQVPSTLCMMWLKAYPERMYEPCAWPYTGHKSHPLALKLAFRRIWSYCLVRVLDLVVEEVLYTVHAEVGSRTRSRAHATSSLTTLELLIVQMFRFVVVLPCTNGIIWPVALTCYSGAWRK